MAHKLTARHGEICALPDQFFGYFGWPTVTRLDDGALCAVASGFRASHVCPFGRTIFAISHDDGHSWTAPRVITDTPLDDRDAGIVGLGNDGLLVSWFTLDVRRWFPEQVLANFDPVTRARWLQGLERVTDELAARWAASWVRRSDDRGETWRPPVRVRVSTPHGPIRLRNGALLYFGKDFEGEGGDFDAEHGMILALRSDDRGDTWALQGTVPLTPGTHAGQYHEPHVVELPSGRLIGAIRIENAGDGTRLEDAGILQFSVLQTESDDGGRNWSVPRPLGFHGSPPHLLRHSSGALVMSYGYRQEPYGERVAISRDDGASWEHDFIVRDDAPDWDLGYPASVELGDGSILTVYYQKPLGTADRCALLWSRWELPR